MGFTSLAARLAAPLALLLAAAVLLLDPPAAVSALRDGAFAALDRTADATRPVFAPAIEASGFLLAGWALLVPLAQRRFALAGLVALLAVLGGFAGAGMLFVTRHWRIDAAGPALLLLAVLALGLGTAAWETARRRRTLRRIFADTLAARALDRLARRPALPAPDDKRAVTYLALGVRGLGVDSAARDEADPHARARMLEQVLTPLMQTVLAHGGMLDRLAADGFGACWNAPLDEPDHAARACTAASAMTERLAAMIAPASPAIAIAIATGPAIVGLTETEEPARYTVRGGAPEAARRALALAPRYGGTAIVTAATAAEAARSFAFLEVDYAAAGPDDAPLRLYALLGGKALRASPKFRAQTALHARLFELLKAGQWDAARAMIAQCRRLSGASQALYDLYLARIGQFERHPPATDWNGAVRPVPE